MVVSPRAWARLAAGKVGAGWDRASRRRTVGVGERQILVHRAHGRRALADRGCDSLGRAGSNVANGKQSRAAGLKRKCQTAKRLPSPVQVIDAKRPVGENEATLVKGRAARQPGRGRV